MNIEDVDMYPQWQSPITVQRDHSHQRESGMYASCTVQLVWLAIYTTLGTQNAQVGSHTSTEVATPDEVTDTDAKEYNKETITL